MKSGKQLTKRNTSTYRCLDGDMGYDRQISEHGEMFVVNDDGVMAECVVTNKSNGVYELKSIAVQPDQQKKGYGNPVCWNR